MEYIPLSVNRRNENAGVLLRPTMMAPARRMDATSGESVWAMESFMTTMPSVVALSVSNRCNSVTHAYRWHPLPRFLRVASATLAASRWASICAIDPVTR